MSHYVILSLAAFSDDGFHIHTDKLRCRKWCKIGHHDDAWFPVLRKFVSSPMRKTVQYITMAP